MFVLMSKKAASKVPPSTTPAAQSSTRTQNACDACRLRKAKCDGQTPCGRCQSKHLVCTSSRRHPKATGPITEEHVATLQQQQRRLTRAITKMADVIKQVEARGFVEEGVNAPGSELSSVELAELLQRFAPEDQTAISEPTDMPIEKPMQQSKKRKFQATSNPDQDIPMDGTMSTTNNERDYRPFEKFFATVQQYNINNPDPTASSSQQVPANSDLQLPQELSVPNAQNMSFPIPGGNSAFEFHPQLAPFVDLVDWDASLDHFLNNQYDDGSFEWNLDPGDLSVQDGV